MRIEKQ